MHMFAVSSTKRGIPSKPEVLERMPLLVYMELRKHVFHGIRFFMVLDLEPGNPTYANKANKESKKPYVEPGGSSLRVIRGLYFC